MPISGARSFAFFSSQPMGLLMDAQGLDGFQFFLGKHPLLTVHMGGSPFFNDHSFSIPLENMDGEAVVRLSMIAYFTLLFQILQCRQNHLRQSGDTGDPCAGGVHVGGQIFADF